MSTLPYLRDHLIFVDDVRAAGGDPRELPPACRRGLVVRVRRGVYLSRAIWDDLDGRERHLLHVLAVLHQARAPLLVAGGSAGAAWELPFATEWPADVTLLIPGATGGKSEPGVRRTVASASGAVGAEVDGLPVTSLARTALDMARTEDFARAVAILDRALWVRNPRAVTRDELLDQWGRAGYVRRAAHLLRAIDFASEWSDSVGESIARVAFHELGFVQPQLQVELQDDLGVIKPDFLWPGIAAGEFDGKVKYTRQEYTHGDPAEVVWREKRREDRLRRMVPRVFRLVWDDLSDRARLAGILTDAGVPRERPGSVSNAPDANGALVPVLEQWPKFDRR
jgi:hypothetical protein